MQAPPRNAPAPRVTPAKSWARAIAMTARLAERPHRTLPGVIDGLAARDGGRAAVLSASGDRPLTFAGLAARANQYARWATGRGIGRGAVVGLLMPNEPDYLAIWLGLTSTGAVV